MRHYFIALSMLVSSCSGHGKHVLEGVDVSLLSAEASDCEATCNSVIATIYVVNKMDEPICFSSRYLNSALASLTLSAVGEMDTDGFLSSFPPVEEFPDNPENPEPFVENLKSEPNVYVPPGTDLRFEVTGVDLYRIPPNKPIMVTLGMYLYHCDDQSYRRFSPSRPLLIR